MFQVDVYLRVRRVVMVEGMGTREASRVFNLNQYTVRNMLAYLAPPWRPNPLTSSGGAPHWRNRPYPRRGHRVPRKQRHTAKRIYGRLRDEYGLDGGYTIVKDYVREHRRRSREMFVPLSLSPGHALCDFGEAVVVISGVERNVPLSVQIAG